MQNVKTYRQNSGDFAPNEQNFDYSFIDYLLVGSDTSDPVETLELPRPWGKFRRIDVGNRFQVKRITVEPNGRLSLQKHHHRSEHWVIVAGTAEVTCGNTVKTIHEGEHIFIAQGEIHQCANSGKVPLVIIEVQIGTYTGEDDIIRLSDIYGRIPK